jgi:hypothetical protein
VYRVKLALAADEAVEPDCALSATSSRYSGGNWDSEFRTAPFGSRPGLDLVSRTDARLPRRPRCPGNAPPGGWIH